MIKRKLKWSHKKSLKIRLIKNSKFKMKYKKIKIIFPLLFLFIYLNIGRNIKTNKINQTKICICTSVKQENLYIREYLEHYKSYGINKIYLYDNNDIDGEKPEDVISDYIKSGFVEIFKWRGKKGVIFQILNDCFKKHKDEYDWVMLSEIDEFIHLYNYTKVSTFLDEPKFKNCEVVHLNLVCHTDNEQLHYENKSIKERFPKIVPSSMPGGKTLEIKPILRGHLNNTYIDCLHRGNIRAKDCDGFGHANKFSSIYSLEPDTTYYYYDHYYAKSTEEFAKKVIRRGSFETSNKFCLDRIKKYFDENTLTMEKILILENGTGFNLSKYKNKLKNKL